MWEFHLATADEDTCRQWIRQHGLLAQVMTCPKCNTVMEEKSSTRVSDGKRWRCPPKNCRHTVSLRRGSFFEKSGKTLTQLADLLYYWCIELSVQEVTAQVQVNENMVISWFNFLREVFRWFDCQSCSARWTRPHRRRRRDDGCTPEAGKCTRSTRPVWVGVRWHGSQHRNLLHGDCPPARHCYTDTSYKSSVTYYRVHASGSTSGGPTTSCRSLATSTRRSNTHSTSWTRRLVCTRTISRPAGWRARQPSSVDMEWRADICRHTWTNTCGGRGDRTTEWQFSTPSSVWFGRSIQCSTDASTSSAYQPVFSEPPKPALFRATNFLQKKATWLLRSLAT